MAWRRTGVVEADLREGVLHGTSAGPRAIVLVRFGGELRAVEGVCPHLGGDLAEGTVGLGALTCPLHGAMFDLVSGAVRADPFGVSPPEGGVGPLPTFRVRVVDGSVEVDVPDG